MLVLAGDTSQAADAEAAMAGCHHLPPSIIPGTALPVWCPIPMQAQPQLHQPKEDREGGLVLAMLVWRDGVHSKETLSKLIAERELSRAQEEQVPPLVDWEGEEQLQLRVGEEEGQLAQLGKGDKQLPQLGEGDKQLPQLVV